MAAGGIRDHLGGGFARYATDSVWLVPHFEKMLYDNAQLALAYLHAWQVTEGAAPRRGRPRDPRLHGPGVAGHGRDRDGRAGRQPGCRHGGRGGQHLRLDRGRGELRCSAPTRRCSPPRTGSRSPATGRAAPSCPESAMTRRWPGRGPCQREEIGGRLADACARLLVGARRPAAAGQGRQGHRVLERTRPGGIRRGGQGPAGRRRPRATGHRSRPVAGAATAAAEGRLHRSWKDGRPGPAAVLEDHTHLAAGLLALYQTTFDERWVAWATELMDVVLTPLCRPRRRLPRHGRRRRRPVHPAAQPGRQPAAIRQRHGRDRPGRSWPG